MVIKVQCPSCSTSFPVDTNKVPDRGVNARCSVCSGIFRVERPEGAPVPSTPEPVDVAPAVEESEKAPVEVETVEAGDEAESDWVIDRQEDIDPAGLGYEPVGTLEEELAEASRDPDLTEPDDSFEVQDAFDASSTLYGDTEPGTETDSDALTWVEPEEEPADASPDLDARVAPGEDTSFEPLPEIPAAPPTQPAPPPSVGAFTFGKQDPAERARRLARVLVSDMIMYNPERHKRALAGGTLKADFEDEIRKSWKEYVEQVGREVAESTDHWTRALNDVLAKGQQLF